MAPTTPTPPPGSGGPGSTIQLTIAVDAKTGQVTIQNVSKDLKGLGQSALDSGQEAEKSAGGWLKLYAQTQLLGEALHGVKEMIHSTIVESTALAARIEVLNTVMGLTAQTMNYSTGAAQAQISGLRALNITHKESIDITLQFIRSQLQLTDATKLATAARDLAVVSGEDTSQALGTLTDAIQTNYVMQLRQYGIVKNLPSIFEEYASSINRTADSLTQLERSQAILNVILVEAGKVSGAYTTAMEDAGKRITSLPRLVEDVQEQIGQGFVPVMLQGIKALEGLAAILKSIPPWVYVVGGSFVATITGTMAFLGAVKALSVGLTVLGFEGATTLLKLRALGVFMATNPYVLAAMAVLTVVSAFTAWEIHTAGETKALITLAQQLQGSVALTQDLEKEVQNMIDLQTRLQDIRSGKSQFTEAELGVYHFISTEEKNQLALERMIANAQGAEARSILEAKQAKIDINDLLDKEGNHVTNILALQERLKSVEADRQAKAAAAIPGLEHDLDLRKQALETEQARNEKLQKLAAGGASPLAHPTVSRGLFSSYGDEAEKSTKQIENLKAGVASLEKEIEGLKHSASGVQLVPVDLNVTIGALGRLSSAISTNEALMRAHIKVTDVDKTAALQAAQAVTTVYADLDRNLTNVIQRRKELNLTETMVARAHQDQKDFAQQAVEFTAALGAKTQSAQETSALLAQQVEKIATSLAKAGENALIYQNVVEGVQQALQSLQEMRLSTHQKIVENQVREINNDIQGLQAENALLGARSKTAADIETIYKNEGKIADLQTAIVIMQDAWAAKTVLTTAASQAQVAAIEHARALLDSVLQVQEILLATQTSIAERTGQTYDQEEEAIRRRYQNEIDLIRNTTADKVLMEAQVAQKMEEADTAVFQARVQRATELASLDEARFNRELHLIEVQNTNASKQLENVDQQKRAITSLAEAQAQALGKDAALRLALIKQTGSVEAADKEIQARQDELRLAAQRQIADLQFTTETALLTMRNRELDILEQTSVAQGKLTAEEAARNKAGRDSSVQALDLLKNTTLTADQVKKWLDYQKELAEITKQQAQAQRLVGGDVKGQAQLDAAKTAQEYGASTKAVSGIMEDLTARLAPVQSQIEELNKKLEEGTITWQKYAGAVRDLTQPLETTAEALNHLFEGTLTTMGAYKAGMDLAVQATNALGKAVGSGGNVGKAMAQFVENMGAEVLQALSKYCLKQAGIHLMAGLADASSPLTAAAAAGEYRAAALWTAAAAAAGFAGGVLSGAAGGGGGGAASGSRGTAVGTPAPVSTKTAMEDNIIKLNDNLVVNNRVMQYAGQAYDKTGAQMFQMVKDINMLAASRSEGDRNFADQLADQLARRTQAGFQPGQMNQLFNNLSTYLVAEGQHSVQYAGILTSINTNLLESSQQQNSQARSMPTLLADRLAENLRGAQKVQNESGQVMIGLARQQLTELQKANEKNMVVSVDASTVLDAGALNTLTTSGFLKNTATYNRAVAGAVTTATQQNVNRQAMGRALGNGGI